MQGLGFLFAPASVRAHLHPLEITILEASCRLLYRPGPSQPRMALRYVIDGIWGIFFGLMEKKMETITIYWGLAGV